MHARTHASASPSRAIPERTPINVIQEARTQMGILGWVILGLIAGAIAKAIHPGDAPGGILGTLAVGVLGAILGGLIASAVGLGALGTFFEIGTWILAIGGALLLLAIYNAVLTRGTGRTSAPRGA
jgi:uncharacterized membrane protein YeaQ/YmgE (transglycosylase-associated protein family)